jgi:cytidylate kinase
VSATYGAAGSIIGPRLAAALGVRFVDRTVSSVDAVASESPSDAEQAAAPPSRWVSSLAQLASSLPGVPTAGNAVGDPISDMRSEATTQVTAEAAQGSVLILGRAAAVVLAEHPGAFHIRLDGPVEARIARAQQIEHIDAAEAARRCEITDRLRALFVRRLFSRDASDLGLYHLVLDTTVLDEDDAVAVLQMAALKFWDHRA